MDIQEFILQIVEVVVIEVEASFQRTVGYTSLTFEQFECLGEDFVEGHATPLDADAACKRRWGNGTGRLSAFIPHRVAKGKQEVLGARDAEGAPYVQT